MARYRHVCPKCTLYLARCHDTNTEQSLQEQMPEPTHNAAKAYHQCPENILAWAQEDGERRIEHFFFVHNTVVIEDSKKVAHQLDHLSAKACYEYTKRDWDLRWINRPDAISLFSWDDRPESISWCPLDHTWLYSGQMTEKWPNVGVSILLGSQVAAERCDEIFIHGQGVDVVISMCEQWENFLEEKHVKCFKFPVSDLSDLEVESYEWYDAIYTFETTWTYAVGRVLQHISDMQWTSEKCWPVLLVNCYDGINRSTAFVLALIMALEHKAGRKVSLQEAIRMSLGKYRRALNPFHRRTYLIWALLAFEARLIGEEPHFTRGQT
eukprot:Skav211188  [mRNA]  locus=scaffold884:266276:267247:+ [translate_table: standard]